MCIHFAVFIWSTHFPSIHEGKERVHFLYSLYFKAFVHHSMSLVEMKMQKEPSPSLRQIHSLTEKCRATWHAQCWAALIKEWHTPGYLDTSTYTHTYIQHEKVKTENTQAPKMSLKPFTTLPFILIKSETVEPTFELYIMRFFNDTNGIWLLITAPTVT